MHDVDLTTLDDDALDGIWTGLLADFAAARDACDKDEMRAVHARIEAAVAEFSRRSDTWISEHMPALTEEHA